MIKINFFRCGFLVCLFLLRSHHGWGREYNSLPCPYLTHVVLIDTIPILQPIESDNGTSKSQVADGQNVKPLIKQIPKSKKQAKPLALPGSLPVKAGKIIKPKIVIKRVGTLGL